jgi:hypothetical protein
MSTDVSGPAAPAEPSPSVFGILGDLIVAPREAFTAILRNPSPWTPLVIFLLLHVLFAAVWIPNMDAIEFVKNQQEAAGKEGPLPPAGAAPFIKGFAAVATLVFPIVFLLLAALVLMFIYRFFYDGQVSFKQSFTIVTWTFTIVALVTIPLMLGAMALKGAWNEEPQMVLSANPTLFLERATTSKPLYALARALDLFTFWSLFLQACGFGVLLRKPTGSTLWGVVVPWAIIVFLGVGWAALF